MAALALLLVCGLLAAAIVRQVVAQARTVHVAWQEELAGHYAEAALSFCEAQLGLPPGQRVPLLRSIESSVPVTPGGVAWRLPASWSAVTGLAITLPPLAFMSASSGLTPARSPACLVERVAWSASEVAYLITARGFSPGHQEDATGATTAGAVVWLQSLLVAD